MSGFKLHYKYLYIFALTVCVTMTLFSLSAETPVRSEYWRQRVSLFDRLPQSPDDIVFVGNSITDGAELSELFRNPNIKNRGINSDDIYGIKERIGRIISGQPAKIFLLIGINDISHGIGTEKIATEYCNLVKLIRKDTPETKIYLISVMPVNNGFNRYKNLIGREEEILKLNKQIQSIAEINKVTYVDLWEGLTDKTGNTLNKNFTNDGLHLNGEGYTVWAEIINRFVEE